MAALIPHQTRRHVRIHAAPLVVWRALTTPELMTRWMGEPSMQLEVHTTWAVGSPIRICGFHHARFENTGTVLEFEPPHALRYSHLSSLSRLSDTPEHETEIGFTLSPIEGDTDLTVTLTGFATESIFKHLDFYWRGTVGVLKRHVEAR